jgi:alkylglycerol monooxygenase
MVLDYRGFFASPVCFIADQALNPAALAIPAFFLFAGLEYFATRRKRGSDLFRFDSSVANMSIGLAERLMNLFLVASFYGAFQYLYEHHAIWNIPNTAWVWVVLILATDLVWYWYHRLGHEINLFWAAHIVHHQSEEFNYTVSARITVLQAVVRNLFWSILPLAGFHPDMVMITLLVHGTYSFFTHTQVIRRLGWLEYILITPSHHRVHHASNDKYLNKNYGDLFVFWDKLFGTFQKEEEEPVYGLTHPLRSYSFMWQHFHYFMELGYAVKHARGFGNKLKLIFGKPELLDQSIRPMLEQTYLPNRRKGLHTQRRHRVYLTVQIAVAAVVVFVLVLLYNHLSAPALLTASIFVILTLINCGALLEQRRWIYYLEYIRLLTLTAYLSDYFDNPYIFAGATLFVVIGIWPLQKWYLRIIYH